MTAPGKAEIAGGGIWSIWGRCRICDDDVAVDVPNQYESADLAWVADAVRAHLRDEHGDAVSDA